MKKIIFYLLIYFFLILLTGCSIRKIVVNQLRPVIVEVEKGILSEKEEKLAADSLPFSIKFAEGLYNYYPTKFYSSKLSLLYAAYSFAYVDESPFDDFDEEAVRKKSRASALYKKAYYYGLKSLDSRVKGFKEALNSPDKIDELLVKFQKKDIEALFWFNFAWAMLLFNDLSDVEVLVNLDVIKKIAERINVLEETYFYGASWAILSAYFGGRTAAIGGNTVKAEEAYNKAVSLSKEKSLIPEFVMMRFVATQLPTSRQFNKHYKNIENFNIDSNEDIAYLNTMLKRKAVQLKQKEKLFFP